MKKEERGVVRCVVSSWDEQTVVARTSTAVVRLRGEAIDGVRPLLWQGMQMNLLDCRQEGDVLTPQIVVVEPDFLMDVTSVAACFSKPDTHPLSYTIGRLKPRPNSQAILLGNFAGAALDDMINRAEPSLADTLWRSFREQALQFCSCPDFDGERFVAEARQQTANLKETVDRLFGEYDRHDALLEPSFICEELGLQGRVDLMTRDLRLLVEQKSGRNHRIEKGAAVVHRTDHFVQLLLYYGILHANFRLGHQHTDIRLLYSKYPPESGLLSVDYQPRLLARAIAMRNVLVAWEYHFARQGTEALLPMLPPMGEAERAYFLRMTAFVYREQLCQRVNAREGQYAISDLWRMPLEEKLRTGNIYVGLRLLARQRSDADGGYDLMTLAVDDTDADDYVRNFRRGDAVCLYAYDDVPDVRRHILYKGILEEIHEDRLVVRLNEGQQNEDLFTDGTYAIEHGSTDGSTSNGLRSIYELVTAPDVRRRQLLLGQRPPECDLTRSLSRSYHPDYDGVLLKAVQARDFFLLVGPPGTGKTSMALRFLVTEELHAKGTILLTAYTNRAVDEICEMLTTAGIDYLRLGNEASCDPCFASHLLEQRAGERPSLDALRRLIAGMPVIVSTTSMLQARPYIFDLKHFSLCLVDEASQILEPSIVGILSKGIDRFVLIGDHKQLPAVVQQQDGGECARSLFERLLRQERQAGRDQFVGVLRRQGRMHPDVAAFTNEFFYREEQIAPVPLQHQMEVSLGYTAPSEDGLDELLKQERVVFFDSGSSGESVIVADLLRRIHRFYGDHFDAQKTVGVIVPYRIEIGRLRREIARLGIPVLNDISIDTVERYQGSQRDVIIYSFAVNDESQLSFLTATSFLEDNGQTIDRKLNVAMTRAREQLLMTGNSKILRVNPIFAALIARYTKSFS